MDRDEAMRLLRGGPEGVKEWNQRREAGDVISDLSKADLTGADLTSANFSGTNLKSAVLYSANLRLANLIRADLRYALFRRADLRDTALASAVLQSTVLNHADLSGTNCGYTFFADIDLSEVKGLDSVRHSGPSYLSTDTLIRSRGRIPDAFLRGCGVPERWIELLPSLIGALEPIQFYSCFISYSHQDEDFARRLHADLQAKGVRCWFAPHDLKTGDRFRLRIDESIRVHDKLLLVLSEGSVASQEVESEVEAAMDREKAHGGTVLFPIRLDDAAMCAPGWPALVRRTRHIGDFTRWKEHDAYQAAFARLLKDLKAVESVGKA
jgi:hypothetical protein